MYIYSPAGRAKCQTRSYTVFPRELKATALEYDYVPVCPMFVFCVIIIRSMINFFNQTIESCKRNILTLLLIWINFDNQKLTWFHMFMYFSYRYTEA